MQTGCDKFPYFDWLMLANPKRQLGISQRVNEGPVRDRSGLWRPSLANASGWERRPLANA